MYTFLYYVYLCILSGGARAESENKKANAADNKRRIHSNIC